VGRRRKLGLAALLCLPGMLRAQEFTFHVPQAELPSRVELSVPYPADAGGVTAGPGAMPATLKVGDWEITVAFDVRHCEISCVYRRIRDVTHLLPPAAEIRLYSGSGSQTAIIVCDPAGFRLPWATSRVLAVPEVPGIPARRLFAAALILGEDDRLLSDDSLVVSSVRQPKVTLPATAPLRI